MKELQSRAGTGIFIQNQWPVLSATGFDTDRQDIAKVIYLAKQRLLVRK